MKFVSDLAWKFKYSSRGAHIFYIYLIFDIESMQRDINLKIQNPEMYKFCSDTFSTQNFNCT